LTGEYGALNTGKNKKEKKTLTAMEMEYISANSDTRLRGIENGVP
jgi:hypothetical protein